jgi:hypothetical protein
MMISHWVLVVGGLALASCGSEGERTERGDTSGMMGHMDSGGMSGVNIPGTEMMQQMRAHMDSMPGMSPQQIQATMASHQAMMSQMLDQMGADMRSMKMSSTPEWTALTDSVKQDLSGAAECEGTKVTLGAGVTAHAHKLEVV